MMSFKQRVQNRLREIHLRQQAFAAALDIDPTALSAMLAGSRPLPLDQGARWAEALRLVGDDAESFLDAMLVAMASVRVQALVDRLRQQVAKAERLEQRYRDRIGIQRWTLDHIDPQDAKPNIIPPTEVEARALIEHFIREWSPMLREWISPAIEDYMRELSRRVHEPPS